MRNWILILLATLALSSCLSQGERKGAETLRNIHNVTLAVKKPEAKISPVEALAVIELASESASDLIDPKKEAPASVTVNDLVKNKEAAFKKIIIDASTLPPTDWGWLATVGGGILVAAGLVGKFMGPPWNLGGMAAEALGRRLVPKYEETKQAAMGLIVATDAVLTNYGELLDTMPEVKKVLADKLGQDPVAWFKKQLQKANTDNGVEPAVSSLVQLAKKHLTTEDGALAPEMKELNDFLAKGLSNLK
jgi:hypothetical protein